MNRDELIAALFVVVGLLILLEQYMNYGVWFQIEDIHHETFALSAFALAIGILIGLNGCNKRVLTTGRAE